MNEVSDLVEVNPELKKEKTTQRKNIKAEIEYSK